MISFKRMRLVRKLQLALFLMVGFTALVGVKSAFDLTRMSRTADDLANRALGRVYTVASVGAGIAESRSAALEVLVSLQLGHEDVAQAAKSRLVDVDQRLRSHATKYLSLVSVPEERKLWDNLADGWLAYRRQQDRAITVAEEGLAGEAQRVLIGVGHAKFEDVTSAAQRLIELNTQHAEQLRAEANASAIAARRVVWGTLVASIALAVALALGMTRAIVGPIQGTIALLKRIGAGHLDNQIDTNRTDEIGELLTGLEAAQAALRARADDERRHSEEQRQRAEADRQTLEEVQRVVASVVAGELEQRLDTSGKEGYAAQLAGSINGLVDNVAEVIRGVGRIVDGANNGDLTQRIEIAKRSGLEQRIGVSINRLVTDMSGLVARAKQAAEEVSRGSDEISRGNESLSKRTEEQATSLEETVASMEQMTATVRANAGNAEIASKLAIDARARAEQGGAAVAKAVTAMDGINEASHKIAAIIGVIDEIAFQTNLLALNAAIEAARAGEHGRGFAAVASEVRNLAGRSATAAREIKTLIQDSVTRADEGTRLVGESGEVLKEMVSAVKKVSDLVADISDASSEQSAGIEQVSKAVAQMDELTQQNAALVEEAAAASKALADQASELSDWLARYRVDTGQRDQLPSEDPSDMRRVA